MYDKPSLLSINECELPTKFNEHSWTKIREHKWLDLYFMGTEIMRNVV